MPQECRDLSLAFARECRRAMSDIAETDYIGDFESLPIPSGYGANIFRDFR